MNDRNNVAEGVVCTVTVKDPVRVGRAVKDSDSSSVFVAIVPVTLADIDRLADRSLVIDTEPSCEREGVLHKDILPLGDRVIVRVRLRDQLSDADSVTVRPALSVCIVPDTVDEHSSVVVGVGVGGGVTVNTTLAVKLSLNVFS